MQNLSPTDLDRYRLYALLEALEMDLRSLIADHLSDGGDVRLGSYREKAERNRAADPDAGASQAALLHYLDLGDEIDLLNEERASLPRDIAGPLRKATERLKAAVPARHRVMHFKPLLPGDLDNVLLALETAIDSGVPLSRVRHTANAMKQDATWVPLVMPPVSGGRVVANLPLPEFDETGLVGRRGDVQRLCSMLVARRYPVITVLGPGGIGKTALAVQTLHDLVDHPDCPYDVVLWVSLKTERLTPEGVRQLRDPLTSIADLVTDLAAPLDDDFSGSVRDLAEALEGLDVLVCVDNLETATGAEALELIDSLPRTVNFLFTSRVGIGQMERIVPVGPLEEGAAVDLLRRSARARDLQAIAQLSVETATEIAQRLSFNPLAIRWFVLSVDSGQRPEVVLEKQTDLLEFCVQNVWASLSSDEQRIGQVMHILQLPTTVQELTLYLESSPDSLRRSVHSLQRRALVRSVALNAGELAEAFALTDTAAKFIAGLAAPDQQTSDDLRGRQRVLLASEERRARDESNAPLSPQTVVVIGEVERPAALVLRDALALSRNRARLDDALAAIEQAREMNPGYFEVDRVRGFVLSSHGGISDATVAYRTSLEKAPDEMNRARVKYALANHLVRNERNTPEARPYAEEAHAYFESDTSALLLASISTYDEDFEKAIGILDEIVSRSEGKIRRIAATQLMEARRRWAEVLVRDEAKMAQAIAECSHAASLGATFLSLGVSDNRMIQVMAENLSEGLRIADGGGASSAAGLALRDIASVAASHWQTLSYTKEFSRIESCARNLSRNIDWPEDVREALRGLLRDDAPQAGGGATRRELGTLKWPRFDRKFGFIAGGSGDVFYHFSAVRPEKWRLFLQAGVAVAFTAEQNEKGQVRASEVTLFPGSSPQDFVVIERTLRVKKFMNERRFGFAYDANTGVEVMIFPSMFPNAEMWNGLSVGGEVRADVKIHSQTDARVVPGSAASLPA